jgi:eukaryotic-like serine/threonine-protein kinase
MLRCPRCGVRLRPAQPVCKSHGVPEGLALGELPRLDEQADADEARVPDALVELGYRLTGVLGRGGFGIVYDAERLRDRQRVAIKLSLPGMPQAEAQLLRETELMRLVGVPHVPAVYDSGSVLGRPFVVIEYVAADTLAARLVEAGGPLPLERFAELAFAILQALAAVHARGIAHRDLKPENVFVLEHAGVTRAKLIDFGLANDARARAEHAPESERADDAIGTAEYMSPEQCDGRADADRRADIYSVGVLFYELLTGAPPFWGKSADVREAHRSRRPAPLLQKIDCSPLLDQVIRRCLAKDRERRYDDVKLLSRALEAALSGTTVMAERPSSISQVTGELKAPVPAASAREKRTMSLVFFESSAGLAGVQSLVSSSGGQIVQTNGAQYVAAFGHDLGDNPVRIALAAAQRLLLGKLVERCLVDVASVSVQARPDGQKRVFSPLFAKKERFPTLTDPAGVLFTTAASEVLPEVRLAAVLGKPDRFAVVVSPQHDATTYGIQQGTLVGRDAPLSTLRESAKQALDAAAPTLTAVVAEAGYGKTHFARALEQQLERLVPTVDVIRLTAQEALVGAASQLLPDLLRRLLTLPLEVPPVDARGVLLERLGEGPGEQVWVGAAFALGWIDAEHPDVRRLAAAPGALRLAGARAAGEALRRRARVMPVAVVLDDAHLADDALLDALEYATLREAAARIWVCALGRPGFAQRRATWGTRAARTLQLALDVLEPVHAAELSRRLLHPVEHVPPSALLRLAERTQGIPRLLVELIRGLKRDGLVRRSLRGTGYYLATDELEKLPDLPIVQWNAVREVEAMPPHLAAHARLSSVLGNGFSIAELEGLQQVLEHGETVDDMQLDASVGVQRLIDAGLLLRHRNGLLDFRHALLRDTIYRLLPESQQQRLHRAAFEMYQQLAMPREQRLPRLALHAARSGAREAAAHAYLELAERSQKAHAYLDAEASFGHALDNLPETDVARIGLAARGRGLMRFRLGRHEDALRDLRRARACALVLDDHERALDLLLDEATVLDWLRDFSQSAALVRLAVEREPLPDGATLTGTKLAIARARIHHRLAEAEACITLGAEAVARAEQLGDAGYEARVMALLMIAPDCANLGRLDEAERYFDQAIAEATEHADLHHLGAAHTNRAMLGMARMDAAQVFDDLTRATQMSRETGEPLIEFCALINMAEVAYAMGELDRAGETAERAIALARQLWGEANRELGACELLLARVALLRGAFASARSLLIGIETRLREAEAAGSEEMRLLPSEQALFDMVELGSRDAGEDEWRAFEQRCASIEMQAIEQIDLLDGHALAALRAGRVAESRRMFLRALAVSADKPNLVSQRVARHFDAAFGSAAQHA